MSWEKVDFKAKAKNEIDALIKELQKASAEIKLIAEQANRVAASLDSVKDAKAATSFENDVRKALHETREKHFDEALETIRKIK